MDPLVAGAVMLGSALSSGLNVGMANKQMRFQERMIRHKHRYQVEDLRAAGLNPYLSLTSPPGAAGGASAHVENPVASAMDIGIRKQLSSATLKQLDAATEKEKSISKLNSAMALKVDAERYNIMQLTRESVLRGQKIITEQDINNLTVQKMKLLMVSIKAKADAITTARETLKFYEDLYQTIDYFQRETVPRAIHNNILKLKLWIEKKLKSYSK